jgi:DNA-binding GntR family transcriptional regulator
VSSVTERFILGGTKLALNEFGDPGGDLSALTESSRKITRMALHQQVAEQLREMIISGTLAPGTRIGERELCDMIHVSRTPLREALKLLATERLVELRNNHGATVAPLVRREIGDLFEALAGIERLGAELAAMRMSRGDIERLRSHQKKIEMHNADSDLLSYSNENRAYHLAIMKSSGNSILVELHEHLLRRADRARLMALGKSGRWETSIKEHRDILDFLQNGDGVAAGVALREHILATGRAIDERLAEAEMKNN